MSAEDDEWVSIGDHLLIHEGPHGTTITPIDDSPEPAAAAERARQVAAGDSVGPFAEREAAPVREHFQKRLAALPDKTSWGDGPWQAEPDFAEWVDEATGLTCVAVRHPYDGHWNGYVAVPGGHPLHGRPRAGLGLTASHEVNYAGPPTRLRMAGADAETVARLEGTWWFGFDYGHATDCQPGKVARERADGWDFPKLATECGEPMTYHTLDQVRADCALLAAQLQNRPASITRTRTMWKCQRCTVGFSPTLGAPDPTECPICGCPADPGQGRQSGR